jgi:hypothetical protein
MTRRLDDLTTLLIVIQMAREGSTTRSAVSWSLKS